MSTDKIRVHIEMIPCEESPTTTPIKKPDGSQAFVLSETEAVNIDRCEQALLQTTYPSLRETLATHLSAMSKKKAHEQQAEGIVVKNPWPYRVDGELGRVEFPTYRVCQDETVVYDTAREVFAPLGCWERYQTVGFKELAFIHGVTEQSYPRTSRLINRIRHQDGATSATTLHASAEREGQQVLAYLDRRATEILTQEGFDATGQPLGSPRSWPQEAAVLPPAQVQEALEACELTADERVEIARNPVLYEQPAHSVNISLDDVVVKKQKPHRTRLDEEEGDEKTGRKYVHNTISHLQHQEQSYCLTGQGGSVVLRLVLGYRLTNGLFGCRLQFFVDKQKTLHTAILHALTWFRNIGMLLDWYHLKDKCARQLSRLAMTGTALRNEAFSTLTRFLWYGRVESAMTFLHNLPTTHLKQPDEMRVLIGYLERNRAYIPCYEVRKR